MNDAVVIDLIRNAIIIIFIIAGPVLFLSIIVGLLVAIFQTTTSIQEQSLVFIPKIIVVMISLIYFSYFIVSRITDYTLDVFDFIPFLNQ